MNKSIILGIMAIICIADNNAMKAKKSPIWKPMGPSKKITIVNTALSKEKTASSYRQLLHSMATAPAAPLSFTTVIYMPHTSLEDIRMSPPITP